MKKAFLFLFFVASAIHISAQTLNEPVSGRILLPNGWQLTPAGKSVPLGDLPLNIAVSPDKKLAAVTNNGQSDQSIELIDIKKGTVIQTLPVGKAWLGLTFSDDGNPERSRFESNAGPCPVMSFGVWQSWHPPKVTRNFPRARAAGLGFDAESFITGGSAAREVATRQHASPETPMNFRSVFITAPPVDAGPPTG